jgi:hypothetical protein
MPPRRERRGFSVIADNRLAPEAGDVDGGVAIAAMDRAAFAAFPSPGGETSRPLGPLTLPQQEQVWVVRFSSTSRNMTPA